MKKNQSKGDGPLHQTVAAGFTDRKLDFVDHEPDVVLQREWGMKT
jgi:hypothetical protein